MNQDDYSKHLLLLADKDIKAVKAMIADKNSFDDEVFGFHSQQAVEKTLKSLLNYYKITFKKTHDLNFLFNQLKEVNEFLYEKHINLDELNDFAVEYRYDILEENEELDRKAIYKKVENFYNEVKLLLTQ